MNFINRLKNIFKLCLHRENPYFLLTSIKQKGNKIFCEFNDILGAGGHLIKINIEDIFRNKNIQKNISSETLLLIGTIYGSYQASIKQYRLKNIDIINQSISLENKEQRIILKVKDLLNDINLINQTNPTDLVRIIVPFVFREGYNIHSQIIDRIMSQDEKSAHNLENGDNLLRFVST